MPLPRGGRDPNLRSMQRLNITLLAGVLCLPSLTAQSAPGDAARAALGPVAPGLVRVDIDLQFDKGEAPSGVMDIDSGARQQAMHSLAQLVEQERPLETTGFLLDSGKVVAMDWTVHPRFVKAIHVRSAEGEATARVEAYALDHWAVMLKLEGPLAGAKPISFTRGTPAFIASHYRFEGSMIRELLPFPGRVLEAANGQLWRIAEHQGVVVSTNGQALSVLLSRRLPLDDSWQVTPAAWPSIDQSTYTSRLDEIQKLADGGLVRTRLSFRSPKPTPGMGRRRFQFGEDEDGDEGSTERDVIGVVLAPNRVAVLASLRPSTTARLQRIQLHPAGGTAVNARFVASLRDHGVLIVEPEQPFATAIQVEPQPVSEHLEKLCFRVDLTLQGENRVQYLHHARIGSVHIGRRLEPFPELADMSDVAGAFLFTQKSGLLALPVESRSKPGGRRHRMEDDTELTPARLLARAIAALPDSADPANMPRAEADENKVAWLGTELQPMSRELARANQVSEYTQDGASGAMVTYVHPGSPAAKAGITPGAVLLRLRVPGEPVPIEVEVEEDAMRSQPFPWERLDEVREQFFERLPTPWAPVDNAFNRALTDLGFGRKATLEYVADGKLARLDFEVSASPDHYESAARFKSDGLGLTVRDLTYDVRRYTQRKADEPGVVISRVEAGSKASVAGIKPFEIVTHVNDQAVANVKEFEQRIAAGGELKLSIKRMTKGRIVTLKAD